MSRLEFNLLKMGIVLHPLPLKQFQFAVFHIFGKVNNLPSFGPMLHPHLSESHTEDASIRRTEMVLSVLQVSKAPYVPPGWGPAPSKLTFKLTTKGDMYQQPCDCSSQSHETSTPLNRAVNTDVGNHKKKIRTC